MVEAKVIADSISQNNIRITTIQIELPKVLLAEFNTHRVFSRNFSSSRAIPTSKFNDMESFQPLYWGKNQPGMEAMLEEIDNKEEAIKIWNDAIEYCKNASSKLIELGLHKQWTNRLNDWHNIAKGIVTSTNWDNFFWLRDSHDAQPEMQKLAQLMKQAIKNSIPRQLEEDEWHLPYITNDEQNDRFFKTYHSKKDFTLQKISAARCCRVSYNKHDGSIPNINDDLKLFDRLVGGDKLHASPLEHQAAPDYLFDVNKKLYGNFNGWVQFRKLWEQMKGLA